jgi:F0F1-type ATP synthase delta subunit
MIAAVVAEGALKASNLKAFSRQTAAYLLSEGRSSELDPLLRDVQDILAEKGHVEAMAVGAHRLSDSNIREIKSKVRSFYPHAKKVVITPVLDPEILGGVRIELAKQQLDLSLRAKLNKFKQLSLGGE